MILHVLLSTRVKTEGEKVNGSEQAWRCGGTDLSLGQREEELS